METICVPFICLVQLLKAIIESNLRTVFLSCTVIENTICTIY